MYEFEDVDEGEGIQATHLINGNLNNNSPPRPLETKPTLTYVGTPTRFKVHGYYPRKGAPTSWLSEKLGPKNKSSCSIF